MLEHFVHKNFQEKTLHIIYQANEIIEAYLAQGFVLTLRQLYYQFVARDLLPNTAQSYNRLGSIINDARLAGLVDWEAIEDRTRNLVKNWHARSPKQAIEAIRKSYGIDMWENQPCRVEVWIEKEALSGVIANVCDELDVPYFACRGYVSQSEAWRAYRRFDGRPVTQETIILHLGDHDPSGIDMTRDNRDRQSVFFGLPGAIEVRRIALNLEQVEEYDPPPNYAKQTDSRWQEYFDNYGDESWELDALEPAVMVQLIRDHVNGIMDSELWDEKLSQLDQELETLDDIIVELE